MGHLPFKIAAIAATPDGSIEARIVQNCASDLALAEESVVFVGRQRSAVDWWRAALKAVADSEVVILHSPLIFSLALAIITKIARKRLVSLVWDVYPVRLDGNRYDGRLIRRGIDLLERLCLAISDLILVPSPDFLTEPSLARAQFAPLWVAPRLTSISPERIAKPRNGNGSPLQVLFAGQVNETRGLDASLNRLREVLPSPFVLKIASFSELPSSLRTDPHVEFLGGLDRTQLEAVAMSCDLGLVSLSPRFDGAAFPSKTFDYLGFGLPVLYCGPRLEAFIRLLEGAGVGLDLSKATTVTIEQLHALEASLAAGRRQFFEETTLKPGSTPKLLTQFGCGTR